MGTDSESGGPSLGRRGEDIRDSCGDAIIV